MSSFPLPKQQVERGPPAAPPTIGQAEGAAEGEKEQAARLRDDTGRSPLNGEGIQVAHEGVASIRDHASGGVNGDEVCRRRDTLVRVKGEEDSGAVKVHGIYGIAGEGRA